MSMTRTSLVDDDGTGTTGTILNAAWKTEFYDQIDAAIGSPTLAAVTTLTLASDTITVTLGQHKVDTEAAAASDTCSTITAGAGVTAGRTLVLIPASAARVVTVKHNVGNLKLAGGDFVMNDANHRIALLYDGTTWTELARASSAVALHATTHKSGGTDALKLDELAAPTDVTTLNASTSAHGLLPKLPNDAGKFLDGTGTWTTRAGSTVTLTDGATPALDASLGGPSPVFRLAAGGDRTIAVPTNATGARKIVIQHLASGGARTLSLNTGAGGFRFGSDITALTQTASGKTDYIGCVYNDTDTKWDVVAVTKGF